MFHTLHKIAVAIVFAFLACVGFFIYQHRAVFDPGTDFVRALWIRQESPPQIIAEVSGDVVQVIDPSSFQLQADSGYHYSVGLGGLEFPSGYSQDPEDLELRRAAKTNLSELILSKRVQVQFTYISPQRSGTGIVYSGNTNVNAAMAQAGFAKPKRQYLKGLSLKHLYALIRAERAAKDQKIGIWKEDAPAIQLSATNP